MSPEDRYVRFVEEEMIPLIDEGRPVLFLPMKTGGVIYGREVMDELRKHGIDYKTLQVDIDRDGRRVKKPYPSEFQDARMKAKLKGRREPYVAIWDDTIASGYGPAALYDWLLHLDPPVDESDIGIFSYHDRSGITEGRFMGKYFGEEINLVTPAELIAVFKKDGKLPLKPNMEDPSQGAIKPRQVVHDLGNAKRVVVDHDDPTKRRPRPGIIRRLLGGGEAVQ